MATIRVRKTRNGELRYQTMIRLKGFPPQIVTFNRKADAKRWITNTEAAIREGRHFKTTEAKKHSLNDLINRYISTVLPSKPKSQLKWWQLELGYLSLGELTPAKLGEARDKLHRGRQPATVVRYMAALSHALTIATTKWGWRKPIL